MTINTDNHAVVSQLLCIFSPGLCGAGPCELHLCGALWPSPLTLKWQRELHKTRTSNLNFLLSILEVIRRPCELQLWPFNTNFSHSIFVSVAIPRDLNYKKLCNVLCLSVVSFNIPTAQFLLLVTAASDLLVHKILLNSILLSPIVSGGVRPNPPRTNTP